MKGSKVVTRLAPHEAQIDANLRFNTAYWLVLNYFAPRMISTNKPLAGGCCLLDIVRLFVCLIVCFGNAVDFIVWNVILFQ